MLELSQYKTAIFDCDGVILDSNTIKSEAFSSALELQKEEPDLIQEFVAYHKKYGGISRYVKFEHFFKKIKKQKEYSHDLEKGLSAYAALSRQGLMECNEIPGVRRMLAYFNRSDIPCHVVSGGDQLENMDVFNARGLSTYFKNILGSPLSKIENLAMLLKTKEINLPGIYFGDARSDYEAASKFNLEFVFISGFTEWSEGITFADENGLLRFANFNSIL